MSGEPLIFDCEKGPLRSPQSLKPSALPGDTYHWLMWPRHPEADGMFERFNGRISDVSVATRFHSREGSQMAV